MHEVTKEGATKKNGDAAAMIGGRFLTAESIGFFELPL